MSTNSRHLLLPPLAKFLSTKLPGARTIRSMATIGDIVLDSTHPASIARFWAAALDGYEVAPYDEAELARLRSMGIDDPEDDPNVLVQPTSGGRTNGRPRIFFQRVPEPKMTKNRVHLDLRCTDAEAEAQRLIEMGARIVDDRPDWIVMADPEGNEFCVMRH